MSIENLVQSECVLNDRKRVWMRLEKFCVFERDVLCPESDKMSLSL